MSETWICVRCKKPIVVGGPDADARYTIFDDEVNQEGMHWECRANPLEALNLLSEAEDSIRRLGDTLRKMNEMKGVKK